MLLNVRCPVSHAAVTSMVVAEAPIELPHTVVAVATTGETSSVSEKRPSMEVVSSLRKCAPIVPVASVIGLPRTALVLAAVREPRVAGHAAQNGIRIGGVLGRSRHNAVPQTEGSKDAFHHVFQGFSPTSRACRCRLLCCILYNKICYLASTDFPSDVKDTRPSRQVSLVAISKRFIRSTTSWCGWP